MLNRVVLMGRITQDLELKNTQSGISVLSFTVAVDRNYSKGEERQTDFISCVAWRQRAEFINNYFAKGRMIAIEGSLQTRTYDDKNGTKHYVTEVVVDNVSFTGGPKSQGSSTNQSFTAPSQDNNTSNASNTQADASISVGDIDDFEVVISDEGVPF